ncbi:MAG: hypothetical protein KGR47_11390 [Acidobacteria bacterium]|nr:hypothetical protein [Acidobacteriota bacterium]
MKRPVLVTIIGVIGIVGGVGQTLFGAVLLGLRNDQTFLTDAKIESGTATAIAIVCMVVGVLSVVFSIGLLRGSRVARGLLGISQTAQIALSVYTLATLDASRRPGAIGTIVTGLIVLYFLFGTDKAKAFFAKT